MRTRDWAAAVAITLVSGSAAMAGWNEWVQTYKTDYRRAHEWPYPFLCADRMAQQAPFIAMADNGWRRENTLGGVMFNADGELTTAGMYKVRWIVTQAPLARRTVWVLRGEDDESTKARVDNVQTYIAKVVPNGALPEVQVTDQPPPGTSGDYLDAIDRSMRTTVAPPRLPAMTVEGE